MGEGSLTGPEKTQRQLHYQNPPQMGDGSQSWGMLHYLKAALNPGCPIPENQTSNLEVHLVQGLFLQINQSSIKAGSYGMHIYVMSTITGTLSTTVKIWGIFTVLISTGLFRGSFL